MPYQETGNLRFYQFSNLDADQVVHGIFTRCGGVSPEPWNTLNLGSSVGDDPDRVEENKSRVLQALGINKETLFEVWQVHQTKVIVADEPRPGNAGLPRADAVITDNPQITLLMRFADCVPLYFFDPKHNVIGLAHAGWKGTLHNIASKTVQTMGKEFGSDPNNIRAGIGPSIGPDHYEIKEDVLHKFAEMYPNGMARFVSEDDGVIRLNLWEANRYHLQKEGVRDIEMAGICTACHLEEWFSHRGENGHTGRFGALFSIQ